MNKAPKIRWGEWAGPDLYAFVEGFEMPVARILATAGGHYVADDCVYTPPRLVGRHRLNPNRDFDTFDAAKNHATRVITRHW